MFEVGNTKHDFMCSGRWAVTIFSYFHTAFMARKPVAFNTYRQSLLPLIGVWGIYVDFIGIGVLVVVIIIIICIAIIIKVIIIGRN